MSNPNTSSATSPLLRYWLAAAVIAYEVSIGWFHSSVAGNAETSGYLISARLLTPGKLAFESGRIPGRWEKITERDGGGGIWKFAGLREH